MPLHYATVPIALTASLDVPAELVTVRIRDGQTQRDRSYEVPFVTIRALHEVLGRIIAADADRFPYVNVTLLK